MAHVVQKLAFGAARRFGGFLGFANGLLRLFPLRDVLGNSSHANQAPVAVAKGKGPVADPSLFPFQCPDSVLGVDLLPLHLFLKQ